MKHWQIKIANFYFKLTEKFTVMEWFFILLAIVMVIIILKSL